VLQVTEASLPEGTTHYLEVASEWARQFLGQPKLGIAGEDTLKFFERRSDAFLSLEGTPTEVKIKRAPGGELEAITEGTEWTAQDGGVRLRPPLFLNELEYDPRYYATPNVAFQRIYPEVQVTRETSETVNQLVVEGVAQAAAAILTRAPREAKGLYSETIGDYSYSSGFGRRGLEGVVETSPYFSTAKAFLKMVPRNRLKPFVV